MMCICTSCFHMRIDYITTHCGYPPFPHSIAQCVRVATLVVEVSSIRDLPADCQLFKHLGFNHMPSHSFFLLSSPSRLKLFAFTLWLNELYEFPAIRRIFLAPYKQGGLHLPEAFILSANAPVTDIYHSIDPPAFLTTEPASSIALAIS